MPRGPFPVAGAGPFTTGAFVVSGNVYMTFTTATLGTFEFSELTYPHVNTIRKFKSVDSAMTMSSSQIKDFGFQPDEFGVIGNRYILTWEIMSETLFNTLKQFYESTETVTWDPKVRARTNGETYVVLIESLTHQADHRVSTRLVSVEMVVNIRSVV